MPASGIRTLRPRANACKTERPNHLGIRRGREILEHAVHSIAEQAAKADDLVEEAIDVGHGRRDILELAGMLTKGITGRAVAAQSPTTAE